MPKVSVIIPVYGVEKYIERCARSLFEQTLDDIEYIFVNDCTKDKSIEVLNAVLGDYPNRKIQVKILHHVENQGLPKARQTGLKEAVGEYVIHCDSDDWVDVDMYRIMYDRAKSSDADIVSCDYYYHDGTKVIRTMTEHFDNEKKQIIRGFMYHKLHWVLWNKMVKRSVLQNHIQFPNYNMGEDMAIVLQILYYCNNIKHIQRPLYYYYCNPRSITNSISYEAANKRFEEAYSNLHIVLKFYQSKSDFKYYQKSLDYLKFYIKQQIPITTPEGKEKWKSVFPHLEYKILQNKDVSIKEKISIIKRLFLYF